MLSEIRSNSAGPCSIKDADPALLSFRPPSAPHVAASSAHTVALSHHNLAVRKSALVRAYSEEHLKAESVPRVSMIYDDKQDEDQSSAEARGWDDSVQNAISQFQPAYL